MQKLGRKKTDSKTEASRIEMTEKQRYKLKQNQNIFCNSKIRKGF